MELNKLEKNFKEKLNKREINPSEAAWDRLDVMLSLAATSYSEQTNQKQKKKSPWMFVAASILGFLLIGTIYFNTEAGGIKIQNNNLVNQNSISTKTNLNPIKNNAITKINYSKNQVVLIQKRNLKPNTTSKVNEDLVFSNSNIQNQISENSIINQKTEQQTITNQTNPGKVDEQLTLDGKPLNGERKSIQKSNVYVDANILLSQVDGELEISFREKVINKISRNYQTVKVALANRNLE